MKIIATNIGERREFTWKNKTVTTGIFKFPLDEPVFLDKEEVRGDEISDRKNHGGINQAIYGYSQKHYKYWQNLYPKLDWSFGMFGENLTIDDLEETKIHVGDTFKVGETIIEVTKARPPCLKLAVKFNDTAILKQFWKKVEVIGIYL